MTLFGIIIILSLIDCLKSYWSKGNILGMPALQHYMFFINFAYLKYPFRQYKDTTSGGHS